MYHGCTSYVHILNTPTVLIGGGGPAYLPDSHHSTASFAILLSWNTERLILQQILPS